MQSALCAPLLTLPHIVALESCSYLTSHCATSYVGVHLPIRNVFGEVQRFEHTVKTTSPLRHGRQPVLQARSEMGWPLSGRR